MEPAGIGAQADTFYRVYVEGGLLIIVRTARRYESVDEIPASFDALRDEIMRLGGQFRTAIVDLREAVGRNDPAFEQKITPARRELLSTFPNFVFVVRTSIGRMQLARYLETDGVKAPVFTSMAEAMVEARRLDGAFGSV